MDVVKIQEVICPFCKSKYMVNNYNDYDAMIIGEPIHYGWFYKCHKCNNEYFITEGNIFGTDLSSIPAEYIKIDGFHLR